MKRSISIQTNIENVVVAENFIDSFCTENNVPEELYGNIFIATTEAVTNAIKHGNRYDPHTFVFLDASITGDILEISVKDEGLGFNPDILPDPTLPENILKFSGRGVYLIKSLSDFVEFLEGGTLVKFSFNLYA